MTRSSDRSSGQWYVLGHLQHSISLFVYDISPEFIEVGGEEIGIVGKTINTAKWNPHIVVECLHEAQKTN